MAQKAVDDQWNLAIHARNVPLLRTMWPSVSGTAKYNALKCAVDNGHVPMLDALLSLVEPGAAYVFDTFEHACEHDRLDVIQKLIQAGLPLDDDDDKNPLLVACDQRKPDVVALLLSSGANAAVMQDEALWMAVEWNDVLITDMLLKASSNHTELDKILRHVCLGLFPGRPFDERIARLLIQHGARVGHLVSSVLSKNKVNVARLLLEEGRREDYAGELDTCLKEVVRVRWHDEKIPQIRLLLQYGARVSSLPRIPWHVIVWKDVDTVKLLLENGVFSDMTSFRTAIGTEDLEMVRLFLPHQDVVPFEIIRTVTENYATGALILKLFLDVGVDLRQSNDRALSAAVQAANPGVVSFLMGIGAHVQDAHIRDIGKRLLGLLTEGDAAAAAEEEDLDRGFQTLALLLTATEMEFFRFLRQLHVSEYFPSRSRFLTELLARHPVAFKLWYDKCNIREDSVAVQAYLFGEELLESIETWFKVVERVQENMAPQVFQELAELGAYKPFT